ncbi:hypothetical protein [Denitromonas ohlonensis]|uniref:Uncharacterized protein n=2 Tax=Denitromonas TaxID=139331 RepID=A0A557RPX8_9RHOO|nr:hypothetical protein [Denitromonas ohlonensis]TVO67155.1 hypothetical protein FHP90_08335 [Denitromonas ohlonensis]TVO79215.1 hypothetical protein FHP89_03255 [Denitromonas ohlonensis]
METWNKKATQEANNVVTDMGIERDGLVEAPLCGCVATFLDDIWRGAALCGRERVGYVAPGEDASMSLHDTRLKGGGNQGMTTAPACRMRIRRRWWSI